MVAAADLHIYDPREEVVFLDSDDSVLISTDAKTCAAIFKTTAPFLAPALDQIVRTGRLTMIDRSAYRLEWTNGGTDGRRLTLAWLAHQNHLSRKFGTTVVAPDGEEESSDFDWMED